MCDADPDDPYADAVNQLHPGDIEQRQRGDDCAGKQKKSCGTAVREKRQT
jgi:hypothetical protein